MKPICHHCGSDNLKAISDYVLKCQNCKKMRVKEDRND